MFTGLQIEKKKLKGHRNTSNKKLGIISITHHKHASYLSTLSTSHLQ